MKKFILILQIFILSISSTQAQLLWKISGKGLKQESYLFGTHHLISISFLDSIPGVFQSFNRSKMVISEVVLNNLDATSKIQKAATLPDSLSISKLLSKADYEMVDKELTETIMLSLKQLDRLHPAMIKTFYELDLYKKIAHFDESTKSDSYFQIVANEKGIPVVGLETIDKQIELLFPMENLKNQAVELVEMIKYKNELINELNDINRYYKKGDIDMLEALLKTANERWGISEKENYEMIDQRNIDWAKQLPKLMKRNACFIAVGALHLPGKNGLIELLRKEGYKVKAVK